MNPRNIEACEIRIRGPPLLQPEIRRGALRALRVAALLDVVAHVLGNQESRLERPALAFFAEPHLFGAEFFAVGLGCARPVGAPITDRRLGDDQRGAIRLRPGGFERTADGRPVLPVDGLHVPATLIIDYLLSAGA